MLALNYPINEDIKKFCQFDPGITPLSLLKKYNLSMTPTTANLTENLKVLLELNVILSSNRELLIESFKLLFEKKPLPTESIDFLVSEIVYFLDLDILIFEWMADDYPLLKAFITKKIDSMSEHDLEIFFSLLLGKDGDVMVIKQMLLTILKDHYWSAPFFKEKCDSRFLSQGSEPPRIVRLLKPAIDMKELSDYRSYSLGALSILTIVDAPILESLLSFRNANNQNIIKLFHDSHHAHYQLGLLMRHFSSLNFNAIKQLVLETDSDMKNLFFQLIHQKKNSLAYLLNYLETCLSPQDFLQIFFQAITQNYKTMNLIAYAIKEKIENQGAFSLDILLKYCYRLTPYQQMFIFNNHVEVNKTNSHFLCLPFAFNVPNLQAYAHRVFEELFFSLQKGLAPIQWQQILLQNMCSENHLFNLCHLIPKNTLQTVFSEIPITYWRYAIKTPDASDMLFLEKVLMTSDDDDIHFLIGTLHHLLSEEKLNILIRDNCRLIMLVPQKQLSYFFHQMMPEEQKQSDYFEYLTMMAIKQSINQFARLNRFLKPHADSMLNLQEAIHVLPAFMEHLSVIQHDELHTKLSSLILQFRTEVIIEHCFPRIIKMITNTQSWAFLLKFVQAALKNRDELQKYICEWAKDTTGKNLEFMGRLQQVITSENASL